MIFFKDQMELDSLNEIESGDLISFVDFNTISNFNSMPNNLQLEELPDPNLRPAGEYQFTPLPTGDLPALDNFEGDYGFNISLDDFRSGKTWLYSEILQQIFIRINNVLIVKFKMTAPLDEDRFFIRAMLMYSSSEYMNLPVKRCTNHAIEDDPNLEAHKTDGVCLCQEHSNVGHVIRSESSGAIYDYDPMSKRHSVLIPVSNPQAGTNSIPIPYTFSCKTSCSRGMQRRPVQIVFTLENERLQVFGRRVVQVKICSCPKRDKERQEKDHLSKDVAVKKPQKRSLEAKPDTSFNKLIKLESTIEITPTNKQELKASMMLELQTMSAELQSVNETVNNLQNKINAIYNNLTLLD